MKTAFSHLNRVDQALHIEKILRQPEANIIPALTTILNDNPSDIDLPFVVLNTALTAKKYKIFWKLFESHKPHEDRFPDLLCTAIFNGSLSFTKKFMAATNLSAKEYHRPCVSAIIQQKIDILKFLFTAPNAADINETEIRLDYGIHNPMPIPIYARTACAFGYLEALNLVLESPENKNLFFTENCLKYCLAPSHIKGWIKDNPLELSHFFEELRKHNEVLYCEYTDFLQQDIKNNSREQNNDYRAVQVFFEKMTLSHNIQSSATAAKPVWKV